MHVLWRSEPDVSPYFFHKKADWQGINLRHVRVLAGDIPEYASGRHEVNITLAGLLTTIKQTPLGKKRISCGGLSNICLTPAGQPLEASWDSEIENLGIDIDPSFLKHVAAENHFRPEFELIDLDKVSDPLIQHLAFALLDEATGQTPAGRLYADSLIQSFCLHILRNYSTSNGTSKIPNGGLPGHKLRRIKEFIEANLEKDISLQELAEVAGLSRFHFARAFRASTGFTPQQYLMRERIEEAKRLLGKQDLPLVEVSLQAGFKNQSHFSSLFRKFTKFTPKTWREMSAT